MYDCTNFRNDPRLKLCFADASRLLTGSGHQSPGLWRHPDDESWRFNEVEHWVDLAKLLEEAKFHGIFIADVLGKRPLCIFYITASLLTETRGL